MNDRPNGGKAPQRRDTGRRRRGSGARISLLSAILTGKRSRSLACVTVAAVLALSAAASSTASIVSAHAARRDALSRQAEQDGDVTGSGDAKAADGEDKPSKGAAGQSRTVPPPVSSESEKVTKTEGETEGVTSEGVTAEGADAPEESTADAPEESTADAGALEAAADCGSAADVSSPEDAASGETDPDAGATDTASGADAADGTSPDAGEKTAYPTDEALSSFPAASVWEDGFVTGADGVSRRYYGYIDVLATCFRAGGTTAYGLPADENVIGVGRYEGTLTPVIPFGTRCYVVGEYGDFGVRVAADYGYMFGNKIDVCLYPSNPYFRGFGWRPMRVYYLYG